MKGDVMVNSNSLDP